MIYNLLAGSGDKYREVDLGEASIYALLGLLLVFIGIAFLILVVWLVGKIMEKTATTSKTRKADIPIAVTQSEQENALSEETVAVITAAIMAYYQQKNEKCDFIVKRIRKI